MKIKWIVLDMDGTLLDSNKALPIGFNEMRKQLEALGIQFVLASGRQYERMRTVVSPYDDKFIYISDNGTKVFEDHQLVLSKTIDADLSREIINLSMETMDVEYVINALDGAYFQTRISEEVKAYFVEFYEKMILVEDFDEVTDFIKLSFYHEHNKFDGVESLNQYKDRVNITRSGYNWIDVVDKDISKGIALDIMAQRHNVDLSSVMVFGDAMNDADMLAVAGVPIVMENADERLKQLGYYETASNDDDGVMIILEKLLAHEGDASWLTN